MTVLTKKYNDLPICEKEILRYAGCKDETSAITELLSSCINELSDKLSYSVCFCELDVQVENDVCDFEVFCAHSHDLAKSLKGQKKVILFAATLGVEIDRLIKKYSKISPSRALMFQAIGTERIEALCDAFCHDAGLGRRFSPGYGDLSLNIQTKIFDVLNCTRNIGIFLNNSLLISPSKSVTAFAFSGKAIDNKCKFCNKTNCTLRGAL